MNAEEFMKIHETQITQSSVPKFLRSPKHMESCRNAINSPSSFDPENVNIEEICGSVKIPKKQSVNHQIGLPPLPAISLGFSHTKKPENFMKFLKVCQNGVIRPRSDLIAGTNHAVVCRRKF